jgi:S1-C subfamily serine protease
MSDETPSEKLPAATEPVALRREALLPNERSRGLGTVAVVCTMAGVASGLALATTLMAMQVADTMSARSTCTYRQEVTPVEVRDHGFLGIRYVFRNGAAHVEKILPGTPAESIGMRRGDLVIAVDGNRIDSGDELQDLIFNQRPGSRPTILIQRGSDHETKQPTLISWPTVAY